MERHLVWVWLSFLLITWGVALFESPQITALHWFGSATFFALIFLLPLVKKNMYVTSILLFIASLMPLLAFWPSSNYYIIIIYTYLAGEVVFWLTKWHAVILGIVLMISIILLTPGSISFLVLYAIFMAVIGVFAYFRVQDLNESEARYDALIHEYRKLKLKSASGEKLARQEERTHIGREIHDRVGHKLTNLLMQLEVTRMEAGTNTKERIHMLKGLAKESLNETRKAVKALDQEEIGGLPAIIRLIRKLEAENFIRIHFSVKNRAFSTNLDGDQTVAVYRAVQEALTNVMRHGSEREASVSFESPGESVFRFEVANPVEEDYEFREGYGLKSMRERLENVDGQLEILTYQNSFIVRGTLPIVKKGSDVNDARVTS